MNDLSRWDLGKLPSASARIAGANGPFLALCLLLVAAFLLGGSARPDVPSLTVLRPLAVLLLGFGLWRIRWTHVRAFPLVCVLGAGIVALPALQLVPLPHPAWRALPGRELAAAAESAAQLAPAWRPLTLTPPQTANALFASLVPAAAVVLGVQLDRAQLRNLLPLLVGIGGVSAFLGLLQISADPGGPLYLYQVTNPGSPVGLFANRNHQALLLAMLLPMVGLLAFRRSRPGRSANPALLLAGIGVLCLVPLILVAGSRVGAVCGAAGLLSLPFLGWSRRTEHAHPGRLAGAALVALAGGLAALTIALGRGAAWDRLFGGGAQDELRLRIFPTVVEMAGTYFPAGSGMGSFERIYQVHERDGLLDPVFMNHAHNDWFEVIVTGGLPALLLLAVAAAGFAAWAWRSCAGLPDDPDVALRRTGLIVILLAALASLSDYPLRVPALSVVAAVAALWSSMPLEVVSGPRFGIGKRLPQAITPLGEK